jgi:hypothetical protein
MPVAIKGVRETVKALRRLDPEMLKEMNAEVRAAMLPIRDKARGYAPSPQPDNLYMWREGSAGKTITARNSMFRTFNTEGRLRMFPLYDAETVKKGIYYSQAPSKKNRNGWQALYFVANKSAAGAIYETAGRKNPGGDPNSRSNNPGAGAHFISRMGLLYGDKQAERGRMIYRAWKEDQGKAQDAVYRAIEKTVDNFNNGRYGMATYALAA